MSHQPYDNWIFGQEELNHEQKQELHNHLHDCAVCNQVYQAWRAAEFQLKNANLVSPAPDFTSRFQAQLEERLRIQQMLQTRRFMLFISFATILVMVVFLGYLLLAGSPVYWLASTLSAITRSFLWWQSFKEVVINLYQSVPVFIPVTLWIVGSTTLVSLTLIWIAALWRIAIKGVHVK